MIKHILVVTFIEEDYQFRLRFSNVSFSTADTYASDRGGGNPGVPTTMIIERRTSIQSQNGLYLSLRKIGLCQ